MTTDHQEPISDAELAVLRHMREHSSAEPSAAVDALILAAASKAVRQPAAPGRWKRLQGWLMAGTHGQRWNWSVGVAGVASLALGLSLTWRNVEQPADGFDQVQPMATQRPAGKAMEQASIESSEQKKQQSAAPVVASEVTADHAERHVQSSPAAAPQVREALAPAKAMKQADKAEVAAPKNLAEMSARAPASTLPTLREELLQVLALRRNGESAAADSELAELIKRYPQQDVVAQLQQLERDIPQSPD